MKKSAAVTLIIFFTLTGIAFAQSPFRGMDGDPPKGPAERAYWKHERAVEVLSLTDREIEKLTELSDAHQAVIQDLGEQIRDEREDLRKIMTGEDFSASSARDHFARAEKLHAELAMERFEFTLEQRELLGQERYSKLLEINRRIMEKRSDHRGARM